MANLGTMEYQIYAFHLQNSKDENTNQNSFFMEIKYQVSVNNFALLLGSSYL